jgi:hypothetical protein
VSFPTPEPSFRLAEMSQPPRRRWLLPVAVAVVLLLGAAGFVGWRYTNRADPLVTACRDAVTAQLKAPATAKWPGAEQTRTDHDARSVSYTVVTGAVDAENGFGSLVRTRFECVFNSDGTLRRAALLD